MKETILYVICNYTSETGWLWDLVSQTEGMSYIENTLKRYGFVKRLILVNLIYH